MFEDQWLRRTRTSKSHLVGQQVELVLQAPRGDTEAFSFRLAGILETNIGVDGPFFNVGYQ